jgi:hypothetical protein
LSILGFIADAIWVHRKLDEFADRYCPVIRRFGLSYRRSDAGSEVPEWFRLCRVRKMRRQSKSFPAITR